MKLWRIGVCLVLSLALAGCPAGDDDDDDFINSQPPAPADTIENVELLVGLSYPTQPISFFFLPVATASLTSEQEGCPTVVDNSDETAGTVDLQITGGGCILPNDAADDTDDTRIDGEIIATGTTDSITYQFLNYQNWSISGCDGTNFDSSLSWNGTVVLTPATGSTANLAGGYDIVLQLSSDGPDDVTCVNASVDFAWDQIITAVSSGADTDMDGEPDEFITYDASGKTGFLISEPPPNPPPFLSGQWSSTATALAHSTIDEVSPGEDCSEPTGGTFAVTSGSDTAEIQPDGLTTCTVEACAPWTLNGVLQSGEICGIPGCRVVGTRARPAAGGALLALGLVLALAIRRRRE